MKQWIAIALLSLLGIQVAYADTISPDFVFTKIDEAKTSGDAHITEDLEGRMVSWPMIVEKLAPGRSAYHLIAYTQGFEVVCESSTSEPGIEWRFYPGTEAVCFGSIRNITIEQPRIVIRAYALNRTPRKGTVAAVPIAIDMQAANASLVQVERAIESFKRACAPLFSHHAIDIRDVDATAQPPYGPYSSSEFDWGGEIHIIVRLKRKTSTFPEVARPNGNNLHYWLGGGRKPGVYMTQQIAEFACGHVPLVNSRNGAFIHISELGSALPPLNKAWKVRNLH